MDEGDAVFIVREGKASRIMVKIGLRERERVQVLEGLQPGDVVVILGQAQLEDGMAVHISGVPASESVEDHH